MLSESGLHLRDVVASDSLVVLDIDGGSGTALVKGASLLSSAVTRGVRVVCFELSAVELIVMHGTGWLTTIASIRAISSTVSAVNKLLLREGKKLFCGNEMSTFKGTSGRESPAGAALTLILNSSNSAGSDPVDFRCISLLKNDSFSGRFNLSSAKQSLVLLLRPVRHVVVTESEVLLGSVASLNVGILSFEEAEAGVPLVNISVVLGKLSQVLNEFVFNWANSDSGSSESSECERFHLW